MRFGSVIQLENAEVRGEDRRRESSPSGRIRVKRPHRGTCDFHAVSRGSSMELRLWGIRSCGDTLVLADARANTHIVDEEGNMPSASSYSPFPRSAA